MQTVDNLIRSMKKQTDALVASDEKLQQFLTWVNQKSLSVKVPYKPAAVRAFYIALDRTLDRALERALDPAFELALLDSSFVPVPNPALNNVFVPAFVPLLNPALIRALLPALKSAVDHTLVHALDPDLRQALHQLKEQLPDPDGDDEILKQWWNMKGQAWTRELREITSHRHIGRDWQFSYQQMKVLKLYYDANLLLVTCLNSSDNVTSGVRKEIEETLLLPIAEIAKRSRYQERELNPDAFLL